MKLNSTLRACFFVGCAFALASCGSKTVRYSKHTWCTARPDYKVANVRQIQKAEWVKLVLSDEDRHYDCTGQPVRFAETPAYCASAKAEPAPKFVPLNPESTVVEELEHGYGLVWIPIQQFRNGDRGGPVGLVHTGGKLSLVALGMLRLPPRQVSLRIERVRGEYMLFAEGSDCHDKSPQCHRLLRLLRLEDGRFVPAYTVDAENRCTGELAFDLAKTQDVSLRGDSVRRFELTTTYQIDPEEGIAIHEQLVVTDRPTGTDAEQARPFRTSDDKRLLRFNGTFFSSEEAPLWNRMMATHGDVRKRGGAND